MKVNKVFTVVTMYSSAFDGDVCPMFYSEVQAAKYALTVLKKLFTEKIEGSRYLEEINEEFSESKKDLLEKGQCCFGDYSIYVVTVSREFS